MTAGDHNAWLARTREPALEPEMPVCDPHHHLWDYPDSRYLVEEFLSDIQGSGFPNGGRRVATGSDQEPGGGHRIVSTIFVECLQFYRPDGPAELRPVGETEFIDSVAGKYLVQNRNTEVARAIVGFADLTLGDRVTAVLEAHVAASSRFRGIRHATAWDASDRVHNAHTKPIQGLMQTPQFRAGLACLDRMGLSFDAWLFHPQIPELTEMAQAFPDLTIVLDHMAGPLGIGPYSGIRDEVFQTWKRELATLARCENVNIKLGGRTMTMAGFGWHKLEVPPGSAELAEAVGPYYRTCIELFGAERCMFESNFPVDKASCSYTVLWNAFKRMSADYSPAERSALFNDTATRIYRLNKPS